MNLVPYAKTLLVIVCPVGFCIYLVIFWIAYKFYKNIGFSIIIKNFVVTAAITFFYFQAQVINTAAGILNCSKIENESYISEYLLERCSNMVDIRNGEIF